MASAPVHGARGPLAELSELLRREHFDHAAWKGVLGQSCHLRIGNEAPVIGRENVLDRLDGLLAAPWGLDPDFHEAWRIKDAMFVETQLRMTGATALPCVLIVRASGEKILDLRWYLDREPPSDP